MSKELPSGRGVAEEIHKRLQLGLPPVLRRLDETPGDELIGQINLLMRVSDLTPHERVVFQLAHGLVGNKIFSHHSIGKKLGIRPYLVGEILESATRKLNRNKL